MEYGCNFSPTDKEVAVQVFSGVNDCLFDGGPLEEKKWTIHFCKLLFNILFSQLGTEKTSKQEIAGLKLSKEAEKL